MCAVRGQCCYFNIEIKGYNVILDNQPCKFLNKKTGLCIDYKNRKKNFKYCTGEENDEMFDVGALPEECLILIKLGRKEARPKIKINKIFHLLKQIHLMLSNC